MFITEMLWRLLVSEESRMNCWKIPKPSTKVFVLVGHGGGDQLHLFCGWLWPGLFALPIKTSLFGLDAHYWSLWQQNVTK
jgi:hypothetical protein